MLSKERENSVIELCQSLIKAQSYSGHEENAAGVLEKFFNLYRFTSVYTDKYGNIIATMKGNRPGPTVLFDGHIDTVPVENPSKWTHDPFAAEIVDGKIYGRGTSDMKGAVAAMANAVANFAADTHGNFPGKIAVAGVVHEECFEGVAARAVSAEVRPDYVVIGESSNLNMKTGQRGRAEMVVETFGVPAHSANPEKGVNAVYGMCKVVEALRKLKPTYHPVLGDGIMELTDIKSGPYPGASVVPDYCKATYDRRLLTGETRESVLAPVQKVLDDLMREDPKLKARVSFANGREKCYTGSLIKGERFFPGWLFDEDEKYIQDIKQELNQDGFKPEITKYNFCTNGSHYAGEAGIRTIGMGPSVESLAHTIDEYVEISQLTKVCECYYDIMKALLKDN